MKRIAILLICALLTACAPTAAPINAEPNAALSSTTETASIASDEVTPKRMKAFRKIKRAIKNNNRYSSGYTVEDSAFELTALANDPCVENTTPSAYPFGRFFIEQPLPKAERTKYTEIIQKHLESKNMYVSVNPIYYYGMVDGYHLFYLFWTPSTAFIYSYTRLAGYQFVALELSQNRVPVEMDENGNLKKGSALKNFMTYTGLILVKDDKAATLEDLYLDGKIDAEMVGKVYHALPESLQFGEYKRYTEAFSLYGGDRIIEQDGSESEVDAYYIAYYDRDGKYHVVVA